MWRSRISRSSAISRRGVLSGTIATTCALSLPKRSQAAALPAETRELRAQASGYNGIMPGPPLHVRRGDEVNVRLINDLPEPTALHWHGVRLPNGMDGAPPFTQALVAPGESFDYRFVAPDAGTYWYHPPSSRYSSPPGIYGLLIIAETEPVDIDQDMTLIFDSTASSTTAAAPDAAPVTVNGVLHLDIPAHSNERLRLRLLNATAGEILGLRIDGLRTFVMALDGEPAEPFAARDGRLVLGPGNRMDVFVDCTLDPGGTAPIVVARADRTNSLGRIICDMAPPRRTKPRGDPQALPPNRLPERMDFPGAFRLDASIGGRVGARRHRDGSAPLFTVKRGRAVVLTFSNSTPENGFIHLHGHHFRLLDALDDGWKPFWLDTMPVAAGSSCRIAFVADNPGKWPIEGVTTDNGTDGWFEVT